MLRASLRGVVALTWVVSVALAFIVVSARSDAAPLPAGSILLATSWTGDESADEFRDALEQFALDEQITVAQAFEASDGRASQRQLFLVDGDERLPASEWLERGVGNFGGLYEYDVRPFRDLDYQSPQGLYFVFADEDESAPLQQFLVSRGMSTVLADVGPLEGTPREAVVALVVFSMLFASLAGVYVVAGTRRYAIGRLHGLAFTSLLRRDANTFVATWVLSGLIVCGLSASAALAAFGGTGLGLFMLSALLVELVFVTAAVSSHVLVLASLGSVRILSALKGSLPTRSLGSAAYALRIVSVVLALTTVGALLSLSSDASARDRAQDDFDDLGDLSTITLGNIFSPEDDETAARIVGAWLRQLDGDGELLLAQQEVVEQQSAWFGTSLLIVNSEFIRRQPIELTGGRQLAVDTLATDSLTAVVPHSRWSERQTLADALSLETLLDSSADTDVVLEQASPDMDVFTYTPDSRDLPAFLGLSEDASAVSDPIILVLPSSQGWLSDTNYMAFMSQGSAMVGSPEVFRRAVQADAELERFLRAATPVREAAALLIAEVSLDLRYTMFSAIMGCVVVIISGAAAALIYTRHIAQRAFVRHIHGWPLVSIYRPILAVEALLLAGTLAWIPVRILRERQSVAQFEDAMGGTPMPIESPTLSGGEWGAMVILAAILVGGFMLALLAAHRRVVQKGVAAA